MSNLLYAGSGLGLKHLGVFQVQEKVQVTRVDTKSVHRGTKWQNLAVCNPRNIKNIKTMKTSTTDGCSVIMM